MTVDDGKLEGPPKKLPKTDSDTSSFGEVEYKRSLDSGTETIDFEETSGKELVISASQEETRAKIALLFSEFFLLLVFLAMVGPFFLTLTHLKIFENPVEMSKTLVTAVASILAGPFGFIVGFYFKKSGD